MRALGIGVGLAGVVLAFAWMHQASEETERVKIEKCVATGGHVYKSGWNGWVCDHHPDAAPKP